MLIKHLKDNKKKLLKAISRVTEASEIEKFKFYINDLMIAVSKEIKNNVIQDTDL